MTLRVPWQSEAIARITEHDRTIAGEGREGEEGTRVVETDEVERIDA